MPYIIFRAYRQPLRIEERDGRLIVRAPSAMPLSKIDEFVKNSPEWIIRTGGKPPAVNPHQDMIKRLMERAKKHIPDRVAYYAPLVGVTYGRVSIRSQKTRWGSCSSNGNLSFNCILMSTPSEALDSIVVHELCHRKVMNHSAAFYDEVLRVYPDYYRWDKWLKENGAALVRRVLG